MSPSFFEKIAGIENDENEKETMNFKEEGSLKVKRKSSGDPPQQKSSSFNMARNKKNKNEDTEPTEPIIADSEEKEKNWLEEAETEEGELTVDVYQTDQDIVIKSTIAGVKPEDIDISFNNDMVTIRGKRVKEEEVSAEDYYYQELYWGSFKRSIILPAEVDPDKAKATIKNGTLTIKLPKSEKTKVKKINVIKSEE